jgi:hypothetical protein
VAWPDASRAAASAQGTTFVHGQTPAHPFFHGQWLLGRSVRGRLSSLARVFLKPPTTPHLACEAPDKGSRRDGVGGLQLPRAVGPLHDHHTRRQALLGAATGAPVTTKHTHAMMSFEAPPTHTPTPMPPFSPASRHLGQPAGARVGHGEPLTRAERAALHVHPRPVPVATPTPAAPALAPA